MMNVPTTEELHLVRDLILLPHMEAMVQRSMEDAQNSTNVLRRLYAQTGQTILNRMAQDSKRLRSELKKRQIQILDQEHSDFIIYHKLLCRGYQQNFGMTRDVMRTEIRTRLTKYVGDLKDAIIGSN